MAEVAFKRGGSTAWVMLIILTMLYTINYMDRMVVSVSMESIKADFNFTDTQMGMLHSVFFFGVGLFTIPAGIIIDSWSRRKAVSLMAIIWSVATVATGMSSKFMTLMVSRFTVACGEAGFAPGGISWISELFPKKNRAKPNGIFLMGAVLGSMLGMALGGAIITKTGDWRLAFYIFAIPGIVLGTLVLFFPSTGIKRNQGESGNIFKEMADLFRIKTFAYTSLAYGLYMVLATTVMAWQAVLLMRAYGLDEAKAGMLLGVLIIPALFTPPIAGIIADRMQAKIAHGRPVFTAIASLVGATAYAIQFFSAGIVSLKIYVVLMMLSGSLAAAPMAIFAVIGQDVVPPNKRGTGSAIILFIAYTIFSWWGSTLVGKGSDMLGGGALGLKMALLAICPFSVAAAFICFMSCRHYSHDSAAIDAIDGE